MPGNQPITWPKAEEATRAVREHSPPLKLPGPAVRGRHGLWRGQAAQWPVDRSQHRTTRTGVGQFCTYRWHLQPGRLCLRQQRNIYICPAGAEVTSTGNIDQGHIVYYRASKSDCSQCSLKLKCATATAGKITRDLDEDVRDYVRALAATESFQQS
jgi:hypothetical protein